MKQIDSSNVEKPSTKYQQSLLYKASPIEGECILIDVIPLEISYFRFVLTMILCFITSGLFGLAIFWYPQLRKCFYYNETSLEKANHFFILNYDHQYSIVQRTDQVYHPTSKESYKAIGFINRYMKYIIIENMVAAVNFNYRKRIVQVISNPMKGYQQSEVQDMRSCFGIGAMEIEQPNILTLFVRQVFRPLYIFILFSVILWYTQLYYYYASVIIGTSAISIIINLYQVRQLNKKIYHMAYYSVPVNVLRDTKVVQIPSVEVVPGDVVFLKDAIKLPFEAIILEGSALINECALTGQSVPIVKKADVFEKYLKVQGEIDKSAYVFQGTTIVQVNMKKKMHKYESFRQQYGIPTSVIKTNFSTLKGQLIRIISFPKQKQNQFQRQSSKFLLFLFTLAVISYIYLAVKLNDTVAPEDLAQKFFDLITITVPPGLPVSMTFGIIFALEKLKDKQIFCISPNKIITGGRINYACFDKTGTLTEDFMDFYGLVPCQNKKILPFIKNDEQKQGSQKLPIEQTIKQNPGLVNALGNMAANHSIIKIQSTGELVGDPMEIKLFQFGSFQLDFSHNDPNVIFSYSSSRNQKGIVYRRFEFDSDVQRMSVVASNSMFNDQLFVYCKGSPEIMLQIMEPSSIPEDYQAVLKEYASHGFRVLAIASKKISGNPSQIQRDSAEKNLVFNGFQIFENKLKKQTYDAIQDLKRAAIPCVMITGDNPLTGSNIAFKCEIANLKKKMKICDFSRGSFSKQQFTYTQGSLNAQKKRQYLQKNNIKNDQLQESPFSDNLGSRDVVDLSILLKSDQSRSSMISADIINNQKGSHHDEFIENLISLGQRENYQFCLTGSCFNQLFPDLQNELSQRKKLFVKYISVYARTKPNQKAKIVMLYQHLGYTTLMCGDGANDCGALKQADVGLSLSQAEASISAPFTSKVFNVSAVVELIKQCRAGLATNFSLFNIMALYSLIQYTTTFIVEIYYAYPSDFQYLYWDMGGNFFFFLTIGYTGTVAKLSKERPNSGLFSISNLFQVLFMFIIQLVGQISMLIAIANQFSSDCDYYTNGGMTVNQARYIEQEDFVTDTPETNILFLFSNFMYIFSLLAFSISSPWRKQFFTNIPFMIVLVIIFTYSFLIVVLPESRLGIFEVSWMYSSRLNWFILGLALGFGVVMYIFQKFIWEPLFNWLKIKYPDNKYL